MFMAIVLATLMMMAPLLLPKSRRLRDDWQEAARLEDMGLLTGQCRI